MSSEDLESVSFLPRAVLVEWHIWNGISASIQHEGEILYYFGMKA